MGYLVFFVLFFALFVWLERRSRELIKLALPNGIEARKFIDDLCEENSWEIIDASQGTFKVLVDETSFGSWGEVITLIESEDGLLVNSSSKDGGLVTLGKDKKNIEKVKTFTNNHYKKEV